MYNAIGQQVYSSQLSHLSAHISIDVRHLAKGVYYLRCLPVGQTGENEVKKVIIE
ncbi:MAG: T9SS type A sorting domain-containing protein [Bacteroidetes bacterium]|nr:T9SS type A sorting domain-containing protein [Bacteroidota bacterium]